MVLIRGITAQPKSELDGIYIKHCQFISLHILASLYQYIL